MVEGCCRKGSRNALQELYNPTQVGCYLTSISALVSYFSPPASVFTFVFYSFSGFHLKNAVEEGPYLFLPACLEGRCLLF